MNKKRSRWMKEKMDKSDITSDAVLSFLFLLVLLFEREKENVSKVQDDERV